AGEVGRGAAPAEDGSRAVEGRWGSREVEITDVAFVDQHGQTTFVFHSGDSMSIRVKVRAAQPTDDFVFGVGLFNADGVCCYGTNTYLEEMTPERLTGDAEATFAIDSLELVEGTYKVDVAVHKRDGYPYDYHRLLYTFRVKSRIHDVGIYRPRHRWSFSAASECKGGRDGRWRGRAGRRRAPPPQGRRVHQRCLRPPAPRARPVSAAGALARRRADRRRQLGSLGARDQR